MNNIGDMCSAELLKVQHHIANCRSKDASFIKIEDETCELLDGKSVLTNYLLHF